MRDKIAGLLGLAAKAGKISSGSGEVEDAVKGGKAKLCVFAGDAQSRTVEDLILLCGRRNIPNIRYSTMEALGRAVGKRERSCIAVLDEGFAKKIVEERGFNGEGENQ